MRVEIKQVWAIFVFISLSKPVAATAQQLDGFTEPIHTIEVATVEPGRVTAVKVKRGQRVTAGSVLIRLDSELLEIAARIAQVEAADQTMIQKLQAELALKREHKTQVDSLAQRSAVSPEEVRRSTMELTIAELALQSAQNKRQLSELRYQEAVRRLERRTILSPADALVIDVVPEPGEFVATSQPRVVTLVQLHELRVTFYLPTEIAIQFKRDDRISVRLDNTPRSGESVPMATPAAAGSAPSSVLPASLPARVEYVAEVTRADSGRVRLDVLIDNRDLTIRAGLRVTLDVDSTLAELQTDRITR